MVDRQPTNPGRVRLNPVSGQPNVFDMSMADGATEQGTPLNKATFLKDATAALYGFPNTAVPDDVFALLGKYNTHCWRRRTYTVTTIQNDIQETVDVTSTTNDRTINFAQTIEVSVKGTISLVNPTSESISRNADGARALAGHAPTYVSNLYGDENGIYYIPSGANVGTAAGDYTIVYSGSAVKLSSGAVTVKSKKVESQITKGEWEFLYSTDRNKYPDSGIVDGYEYEYLGVPFDKLPTAPKIETGSYVGTGTYGEDNPNSLTFSFAPKVVVLYYRDAEGYLYGFGSTSPSRFYAMFSDELTELYQDGFGFSFSASSATGLSYGKKSDNGKTYSWYSTLRASTQANSAGQVYHYIGIG